MEPDVSAELAVSASQHHVQVSTLAGDENSSTTKKVRDSVVHDVVKWSDMLKGHLGPLYALQKYYKGVLSVKVINYLLTCFGYALSQNKGKQDSYDPPLWGK